MEIEIASLDNLIHTYSKDRLNSKISRELYPTQKLLTPYRTPLSSYPPFKVTGYKQLSHVRYDTHENSSHLKRFYYCSENRDTVFKSEMIRILIKCIFCTDVQKVIPLIGFLIVECLDTESFDNLNV